MKTALLLALLILSGCANSHGVIIFDASAV